MEPCPAGARLARSVPAATLPTSAAPLRRVVAQVSGAGAAAASTSRAGRQPPPSPGLLGVVSSVALAAVRRRRRLQVGRPRNCRRVQLGPFRRDLSLDGYPVHGPGYYWTLAKNTEAIQIYMPIADDVSAKDVIFECRDFTLKFGMVPEKGGLVINDKVLYKVDVETSYFIIDDGEFGERCAVAWLEKLTKEQDWYAYDRFDPVSERFLLEGEKKRAALRHDVTHKTFLDIEIDGTDMGRIVLGLYGDIAPRTVENFRCLCTGEKGKSEETDEPLHYKGASFHRIIRGFCIQGGQTFEDEDGTGGESIYGATFDDENLRVKFNKPYMLAMASGGPDTNGSQFFITTAKADHLSHKCVGFGEVLEGNEVVKAIEFVGTDDGEPTKLVVIKDCGELDLGDVEALRGEVEKVIIPREQEDELRQSILNKNLIR
mmetsp:Transcript_59305/g.130248  ORF Transcript_59305/g.130248 Transcript_59305/m.130248 type:complete len:430 (-) Transcript_59305:68-1357(-)